MQKAHSLVMAIAMAAAASIAHADTNQAEPSGLRPFVGIGFTSGGDTIEHDTINPIGTTTQYQEDISAGGGLDLRLGLSYKLGTLPLTLQGSWGMHNDQASGAFGGHAFFRRYPLELMLQWHATDRTKIGFGLRTTTGARFHSEGDPVTTNGVTQPSYTTDYKFKSSTGLILETEWAATPSWGLKARYVHESYRRTDIPDGEKYQADHLGLLTVFYFD